MWTLRMRMVLVSIVDTSMIRFTYVGYLSFISHASQLLGIIVQVFGYGVEFVVLRV